MRWMHQQDTPRHQWVQVSPHLLKLYLYKMLFSATFRKRLQVKRVQKEVHKRKSSGPRVWEVADTPTVTSGKACPIDNKSVMIVSCPGIPDSNCSDSNSDLSHDTPNFTLTDLYLSDSDLALFGAELDCADADHPLH